MGSNINQRASTRNKASAKAFTAKATPLLPTSSAVPKVFNDHEHTSPQFNPIILSRIYTFYSELYATLFYALN